MLDTLLPPQPCRVLVAGHVEACGVDLFRAVCERDLEGIVAKRLDGLYTPDASDWLKIKNPAYSQAEGRFELFEQRNGKSAANSRSPLREAKKEEKSGFRETEFVRGRSVHQALEILANSRNHGCDHNRVPSRR